MRRRNHTLPIFAFTIFISTVCTAAIIALPTPQDRLIEVTNEIADCITDKALRDLSWSEKASDGTISRRVGGDRKRAGQIMIYHIMKSVTAQFDCLRSIREANPEMFKHEATVDDMKRQITAMVYKRVTTRRPETVKPGQEKEFQDLLGSEVEAAFEMALTCDQRDLEKRIEECRVIDHKMDSLNVAVRIN